MSPVKLCKTGARDLMARSCYKKPFFGKKIIKKSANPSSMPSPLLGDFSGKEWAGCYGNRCKLLSVKKGP